MAKSTELTPKQEDFCRYYAVENLSQRQSYIAAYGKGNKTDKSIDELASRLTKNIKIASRLQELKESLAERALWSKADMINDLKEISNECKIAPITTHYFGKDDNAGKEERIDSKARAVAVNAIKTAGEMLGYKAPEKVEVNGTLKLEDIMNKIGGKSDY